jgi:hypothetical protein
MYKTSGRTVGLFTLTQVCFSANDYVVLEGTTIGRIAARSSDPGSAFNTQQNGECVNFTPGLAIPPAETLLCIHLGGSGPSSCILTGIKSPPAP